MCMMLYLASEMPLPLLAPWKPGMPLSIEELRQIDEAPVREQLATGHLYYVGSDEGCGCGFAAKIDDSTGEPYPQQITPSRSALKSFLTEHLRPGTAVRLFSCWDGDQSLEIEHTGRLTTSDLVTSSWRYREHERLEMTVA